MQRASGAVTLRFSGNAQIERLRVVDARGIDRANGLPYHPDDDPRAVAVRIPPLPHGRYAVDWRVVADDGHVARGRFAFGVGVPAGVVPDLVSTVPGAGEIVAVLRFLLLAGLLTGVGMALGAWLVVPAPHVAPVSLLEFAAWLVVAFVAFADVWVQAVLSEDSLASVVSARYGTLHLTLCAAALLGAIAVSRKRRQPELLITAILAALACEALGSHGATTALPLAGILVDGGHTIAAAAWIGVLLVTLGTPALVDVRRTSNVATWAIALLLVTAVAQLAGNLGSLSALSTTAYGLEICAKAALFAVAGAIALQSRRRLTAGALGVAPSVRFEVLVLTLVIAVTAVLVDTPPPR